MVLLIGGCLRRGPHIAQTTGGALYRKDAAQRSSRLTPPETGVQNKLPFVHSDISAVEVTLWLRYCGIKEEAM